MWIPGEVAEEERMDPAHAWRFLKTIDAVEGTAMQLRRTEVVRVASPGFLVNSAGKACRYTTWTGWSLDDGYYFALWPRRCGSGQYDARVRFYGPTATEAQAKFIEVSARALGLLDKVSSLPRSVAQPKPARRAVFGVASGAGAAPAPA